MKNQKKRAQLDIDEPIEPYETILANKIRDKNITRDEAVRDILATAVKTRKSVNKELGLEG